MRRRWKGGSQMRERDAGIAWQTTNPTAIYTHNLQINFTPNCGQSICHALSPKRVPSGEEEEEGEKDGRERWRTWGSWQQLAIIVTWLEPKLAPHATGTWGEAWEAGEKRLAMQIWCNSAAEQSSRRSARNRWSKPSNRSERTKQGKKTRSQGVGAKEHPRCLDTARGKSPRGQVQNIFSTIANTWALYTLYRGRSKG